MRLKTKLIVVMALVAIVISIISISINGYFSLNEMKKESLIQYEDSLKSKRAILTLEIVDYFKTIEHQIQVMASDISIVEATSAFKSAFNSYPESNEKAALQNYYQNEFKPVYDEQNQDSISIPSIFNALPSKTLSLQSKYIAENSNPLGSKDGLTVLGDNSDYDITHQRYHPTLRNFLQKFGYYDIFIVDPDTGYIVYSVFKELDYATSLKSGPYRNSGIAKAFNQALSLANGEVYLTDFDAYLPSYNNAASFISSPIYENGEISGVLIYQMPIDTINQLMTQHGKWVETGFGKSGETYLVGENSTLRSESRFFVEDESGFISSLKNSGIDTTEIENKGTSISLLSITSDGAKEALAGRQGFAAFSDYRGETVLSSYGPVKVGNLNWAMMSEVDEVEALEYIVELKEHLFVITLLIILGVAVVSVIIAMLFANSLVKPLISLARRFTDLSEGEGDLTSRVPHSSTPELNAIGQGFNTFIEQLQGVIINSKGAVNQLSSSGYELNVSTEESQKLIKSQADSVTDLHNSIVGFTDSAAQITELTISASEATTVAQASAKENAERADLASENITQLVEEVTKSANFISELQGNVQDISDVLGVINSIADQTNLLALNAAIEAARAGEHGRGFAVVADEVRTLAKRTQESTVTIQKQISQLTKVTENSVDSMERASVSAKGGIHLVSIVSETLQKLNEFVGELASMNTNIADSSKNQSSEVELITQTIEALKEESGIMTDISQNIVGVSHELSTVSTTIKTDMDRFKT